MLLEKYRERLEFWSPAIECSTWGNAYQFNTFGDWLQSTNSYGWFVGLYLFFIDMNERGEDFLKFLYDVRDSGVTTPDKEEFERTLNVWIKRCERYGTYAGALGAMAKHYDYWVESHTARLGGVKPPWWDSYQAKKQA